MMESCAGIASPAASASVVSLKASLFTQAEKDACEFASSAAKGTQAMPFDNGFEASCTNWR